MAFIDDIISQAKDIQETILLPEAEDERTLKAAEIIQSEGIAKVVLVGDSGVAAKTQASAGVSGDFEVIDPAQSADLDAFSEAYYEMRKAKGMTPEKARETMLQPIPYGIMMLHQGKGGGLVAGACHSTGDTLRPALQILRTAPGSSLVSSFFFMVCGGTTYLFADCGLVEDPSAEQLGDIAIATAGSAAAFGIPPKVAMISYSTKGSASGPLVEKVQNATERAQAKAKDLFSAEAGVEIDGELQVDAAIVEKVGEKKAPGSSVAGHARVLIFPDLDAGNSAYKLVQRLAGAEAYGPIIQGIRKPVNDLSRGCSADDIVGVAAITAVQARMAKANESA